MLSGDQVGPRNLVWYLLANTTLLPANEEIARTSVSLCLVILRRVERLKPGVKWVVNHSLGIFSPSSQ